MIQYVFIVLVSIVLYPVLLLGLFFIKGMGLELVKTLPRV
jgi:hypothetical protein